MRPVFSRWSRAAVAAFGVSAIVLGLYYNWFAVANRYAVFLYEHLGAAPFDAVTRSRYWMTGLVAAGVVLLLYTGANWALARLGSLRRRSFSPPSWARVWLLSAPPLAVGIVWLTTTQNAPTLPVDLALQAALSALVGLALALWPGAWAAQRPLDLLWLAIEGAGVALVLQLAAGFSICYLLLPLAHYLFATPPGYRYITTAGNFFASSLVLQVLVWAAAVGVVGVVHLAAKKIVCEA